MKQATSSGVADAAVRAAARIVTVGLLSAAGWEPGTLPWYEDDGGKGIWADASPVMSGMGGAGANGMGGANGAGGAGGKPAVVNADSPVADCPEYKTVGGMDKFFQNRCANSAACHQQALLGDYKKENVWS